MQKLQKKRFPAKTDFTVNEIRTTEKKKKEAQPRTVDGSANRDERGGWLVALHTHKNPPDSGH